VKAVVASAYFLFCLRYGEVTEPYFALINVKSCEGIFPAGLSSVKGEMKLNKNNQLLDCTTYFKILP
jgi:hypothetical protein